MSRSAAGADPLAGEMPATARSVVLHVARKVPVVRPDATAAQVWDLLRGTLFDSAADVAVCEGERLVGMLRLEDALASGPDVQARELMEHDPPVVHAGADQEVAAWKAVHHGVRSLAVVEDGRFVGLVPPRRLLEVLLAEHDEDLARLSGVLHRTSMTRDATEEKVARRLSHRLPWLLVGLMGAIGAAGIVGSFEGQLSETVLLAFFVPGVVYMADAVGTQTEAIVIRGLSVGVPVRRIVGLELLTGLLLGVVLAGTFLPIGLVLWGRVDVALTVALALLGACATATAIGMALPWALSRLGRDPAFGSGPLATVVQDLLSLLIYFGLATLLVG